MNMFIHYTIGAQLRFVILYIFYISKLTISPNFYTFSLLTSDIVDAHNNDRKYTYTYVHRVSMDAGV